MEKLDRPSGLIRYASEAEIEGDKTRLLRARPVLYSVAILSVFTVFALLLSTRIPLEMDVVREARGGAFSQSADGRVSNRYNVRLINKEAPDMTVQLSLEGFEDAELVAPVNPITVEAESSKVMQVFVLVDPKSVKPVHRFKITATDSNDPNTQKQIETTFLRGAK